MSRAMAASTFLLAQLLASPAPAHGRVTVQPGEATVNMVRNNAPDCTGRTYPATVILFAAQPDFHGMDQFD